MTRDEAITLAKRFAADAIRTSEVTSEPSNVFETDWPDDPESIPVWIVHFDYILEAGECWEPSSLGIIIDKRTGCRIPFMAM